MADQAQAATVDFENDYSAGFAGKTAEDAPAAEPLQEPVVEKEVTEQGEVKPPEGEGQPPAEEVKPPAEDWEKRFKDTRADHTRISQENADLKKRLDELEAKLNAKPAPEEEGAEDEDADLDELFTDYAGAPKAIRREAERLLKEKFGDFDPVKAQEAAIQTMQLRYDNAVIYGVQDPESKAFVPGVTDYYAITNTPAYWDWYAAKGYNVPEGHPPWKAIAILNEYKAEQAEKTVKAAVTEHDQEAAKRAEEIKASASGGLPAGVRKTTTTTAKKDDNDFGGGFREAAST